MDLRLSVEEEILQCARERAEASGEGIIQLVREYLELRAGKRDLPGRRRVR
jgi:hypothetical protein